MRLTRRLAVAAALCALTAACDQAVTAPQRAPQAPRAIVDGTPTGSSFGSVGALLVDFDNDGKITGLDQDCTGSLISPTIFLTAAHCVEFLAPGTPVYVSFDPELMPAPRHVIAATAWTYDYRYGHDQANLYDLAVVFLPKRATTGMTPYKLPSAGYLDDLQARGGLTNATFVNVGYGIDATASGIPTFSYDGVRKYSYSAFMGLQQYWLGLLMNSNATSEGGDCYGDSGGPKFLDGHLDTIVATVTTGDWNCRATSWDYRLDTVSAREFLGRFVTLP
jgi:trypsin